MVNILSVGLDDESLELLAQRTAALVLAQLANGVTVGQTAAAPAPAAQPPAQAAPPQQPPDPWAAQRGQQAAPAAPAAPTQGGVPTTTPTCAHGPMRHVPAGFARSTGKAYPAFWGCTQPKGAPDQCKSIPA